MGKLRTVKEVKELTGLSSKQLYDYDVLGIVKPTERKHRGYEKKDGTWYDGYKMYDEEAVMKLQQIGIFNRLHVKRSVMKEKMTSKNYDFMVILDEQMELLQKQKEEIEDMILIIEQLKMLGMKGEVLNIYSETDFHEMAEKYKQNKTSEYYLDFMEKVDALDDLSAQKIGTLFEEILDLKEDEYKTRKSFEAVHRLLEGMAEYLGYGAFLLICSYSIGIEGDGTVAASMVQDLGKENAEKLEQACINYMEHFLGYIYGETAVVLADNNPTKPKTFNKNSFIEQIKAIFYSYLGVRSKEDYELFFEMYSDLFEIKDEDFRFVMNTLREHFV